MQTEISQHIAAKLRLRLTRAEQQQLVKEAKDNPQAFELVLKLFWARRYDEAIEQLKLNWIRTSPTRM